MGRDMGLAQGVVGPENALRMGRLMIKVREGSEF